MTYEDSHVFVWLSMDGCVDVRVCVYACLAMPQALMARFDLISRVVAWALCADASVVQGAVGLAWKPGSVSSPAALAKGVRACACVCVCVSEYDVSVGVCTCLYALKDAYIQPEAGRRLLSSVRTHLPSPRQHKRLHPPPPARPFPYAGRRARGMRELLAPNLAVMVTLWKR